MSLFSVLRLSILLVCSALFSAHVAATPEFTVEIKNHLFIPSVLEIPANTKVKLKVVNQDSTPEEFESYELNREKIVVGGGKITIFIGPLAPGEYPFFGEFNPRTAQGVVLVK
jgi:hypothetical protein